MEGHCVVRNLALTMQRKFWPTSLGSSSEKGVFVIPGGPLRPHLIIYANKMTQGEPLEPGVSQICRERKGLQSKVSHVGKE